MMESSQNLQFQAPSNVAGVPTIPLARVQKNPVQQPAPNETLYIRNLIETRALGVLKESLRTIFSQYGEILDIIVKRNIKLRGQAFVIYKDKESSANAMKEIQGFPLFSNPMDIQYAKDRSYKITELIGGSEAVTSQRKRRHKEMELRGKEAKKAKTEPGYRATQFKSGSIPDELLPPNSILFIQNLPPESSEVKLNSLFKQFPGFKEVRLVPGKESIAFVEYEDENQASLAKRALNKYRITPKHEIRLTFAKK